MLKTFIHRLLKLFYPLVRKLLPYQVYAYLATGAANTVLNIVLFAFLYQVVLPQPGIVLAGFFVTDYTISLLLAFACTVPTGYWLARHFAFADGSRGAPAQMGKYFLVVLQGLLSDYLLMKMMIEWGQLHPTLAKALSTVVVLTANYLLQKHFTFKKEATVIP